MAGEISGAPEAFPFVLLCLTLTGVENISKSLFIGLEQMQFTAYFSRGRRTTDPDFISRYPVI